MGQYLRSDMDLPRGCWLRGCSPLRRVGPCWGRDFLTRPTALRRPCRPTCLGLTSRSHFAIPPAIGGRLNCDISFCHLSGHTFEGRMPPGATRSDATGWLRISLLGKLFHGFQSVQMTIAIVVSLCRARGDDSRKRRFWASNKLISVNGRMSLYHKFQMCRMVFRYIYLRRAARTGGFRRTTNDGCTWEIVAIDNKSCNKCQNIKGEYVFMTRCTLQLALVDACKRICIGVWAYRLWALMRSQVAWSWSSRSYPFEIGH